MDGGASEQRSTDGACERFRAIAIDFVVSAKLLGELIHRQNRLYDCRASRGVRMIDCRICRRILYDPPAFLFFMAIIGQAYTWV